MAYCLWGFTEFERDQGRRNSWARSRRFCIDKNEEERERKRERARKSEIQGYTERARSITTFLDFFVSHPDGWFRIASRTRPLWFHVRGSPSRQRCSPGYRATGTKTRSAWQRNPRCRETRGLRALPRPAHGRRGCKQKRATNIKREIGRQMGSAQRK